MKVDAHGSTDLGRKRSINEDNYKICPQLNLFLVADGMGGHIAGEIASRLAVDIIAEVLLHENEKIKSGESIDVHPGQLLLKSIQIANRKILETAQKRSELEGMGTTVIASFASENTLHLASVGDSRIYRFRENQGKLLTSDHSWVNMQIRLGNLTVEEARYHPMRNVITRALGTQPDVEADITSYLLQNDDFILMCSDGLSNAVKIEEMASVVINHGDDLEQATNNLIRIANDRGGDDNITVVLLKFAEIDACVHSNELAKEDSSIDDDSEQDTEIIPKAKLYRRMMEKRFPHHPP